MGMNVVVIVAFDVIIPLLRHDHVVVSQKMLVVGSFSHVVQVMRLGYIKIAAVMHQTNCVNVFQVLPGPVNSG